MSRTVFYCRCGARLEGASARLYHRCPPAARELEQPDPAPVRAEEARVALDDRVGEGAGEHAP